jgi:hypothetical protein
LVKNVELIDNQYKKKKYSSKKTKKVWFKKNKDSSLWHFPFLRYNRENKNIKTQVSIEVVNQLAFIQT